MILVILAFTILLLMFLISPVWYKRSADVTDQSAENLRLYKERQQDLQESDLDEASRTALKLELDREFLATTRDETQAVAAGINHKRWLAPVILLLIVMGSSVAGYQFWGASVELKATDLLNKSAKRELLPSEEKQLMESVALAAKRNSKHYEWAYIHGRLNMSQGKFDEAATAFADLLFNLPIEADEDRASIMVQLAEARLAAAKQQPSNEIYELLDEALKIQPNQAQARAMAGMMAFQLGNYNGTIKHWGELWKKTSENEYATILEQGIRRAAAALEEQGETADLSFLNRTAVTLLIDVSDEAKKGLPANTTVFVAATALEGPPMPLAAQRLTLGELPKQITLSDAQAMMPGMSLSDYKQVKVRATLSISGEPSAKKGDWQAEVSPVANDHEGVIKLEINKQL